MLYLQLGEGKELQLHVGAGLRFCLPDTKDVCMMQADGDELEAIKTMLPGFCPPHLRVVKWEGSVARFVYEYGALLTI